MDRDARLFDLIGKMNDLTGTLCAAGRESFQGAASPAGPTHAEAAVGQVAALRRALDASEADLREEAAVSSRRRQF